MIEVQGLGKEQTMARQALHSFLGFWIMTVVVCGFGAAPGAFAQTLWRIGTFNDSSGEFNPGNPGAPLFGQSFPKGDLVYVVGKSSPDKDWPAF